MKNRLVLVEDEKDLAENYAEILEDLGYEVLGRFDNALSVLDYLRAKRPDLLLMDINLKGETDGVALAKLVTRDYGIPIIFTTAYSGDRVLREAFESFPVNYLVKPISRDTFKTALYLAFNQQTGSPRREDSTRIQLKAKGYVFYLFAEDIVYLKADGLYTAITTKDGKTYLERGVLKILHKQLPEKQFIRVHKSYVINLRYVKAFNSKSIEVINYKIPMRRAFYAEFKSLFTAYEDL